jgi:hypothetical protein
MSVFERGETYYHQRKFYNEGSIVTPDTASMKIEFPCGTGSTSKSMASTAGVYFADYDIPSNATYGEYTVIVTMTIGDDVSKFIESFYILPWNIIQQVRGAAGIKESNDVDDNDIALICWNSYLEAKELAFQRNIDVPLHTDGYHLIDGSNKTFYVIGTRLVSGYSTCDEDDISGYYVDCYGERKELTISISDAIHGEITVADENGDALSNTVCNVYITYRTHTAAFTEQLFKKAVTYLSAHEVVLRFNELDKATLADLSSNRMIVLANPDRMLKQFKQTMKKIKALRVGGC